MESGRKVKLDWARSIIKVGKNATKEEIDAYIDANREKILMLRNGDEKPLEDAKSILYEEAERLASGNKKDELVSPSLILEAFEVSLSTDFSSIKSYVQDALKQAESDEERARVLEATRRINRDFDELIREELENITGTKEVTSLSSDNPELIDGTTIPKPRHQLAGETDRAYITYLKHYYESSYTLFNQSKTTIEQQLLDAKKSRDAINYEYKKVVQQYNKSVAAGAQLSPKRLNEMTQEFNAKIAELLAKLQKAQDKVDAIEKKMGEQIEAESKEQDIVSNEKLELEEKNQTDEQEIGTQLVDARLFASPIEKMQRFVQDEKLNQHPFLESSDEELKDDGLDSYDKELERKREEYLEELALKKQNEKKQSQIYEEALSNETLSMESIMEYLTYGLEDKFSSTKYTVSGIKVSGLFKSKLLESTYSYNFVSNKLPSMFATFGNINKFYNNNSLNRENANIFNILEKRVSKLNDDNLLTIYWNYKPNKEKHSDILIPLLGKRIAKFVEKKVNECNEELSKLYNRIKKDYFLIISIERELRECENDDRIEVLERQREELLSNKSSLINEIRVLQDTANAWFINCDSCFDEDLAIIRTKTPIIGYVEKTSDSKKQEQLEKLHTQEMMGDNITALKAFLKIEKMNIQRSNEMDSSLTGLKYHSPLQTDLRYKSDDFVRNLAATLAMAPNRIGETQINSCFVERSVDGIYYKENPHLYILYSQIEGHLNDVLDSYGAGLVSSSAVMKQLENIEKSVENHILKLYLGYQEQLEQASIEKPEFDSSKLGDALERLLANASDLKDANTASRLLSDLDKELVLLMDDTEEGMVFSKKFSPKLIGACRAYILASSVNAKMKSYANSKKKVTDEELEQLENEIKGKSK